MTTSVYFYVALLCRGIDNYSVDPRKDQITLQSTGPQWDSRSSVSGAPSICCPCPQCVCVCVCVCVFVHVQWHTFSSTELQWLSVPLWYALNRHSRWLVGKKSHSSKSRKRYHPQSLGSSGGFHEQKASTCINLWTHAHICISQSHEHYWIKNPMVISLTSICFVCYIYIYSIYTVYIVRAWA